MRAPLAIEVACEAGLLGEGGGPASLVEAPDVGWVEGDILEAVVVKDVDLGRVKGGLDHVIELAIDVPIPERLAQWGGCYCLAASVPESSPHI